MAARVRAATGRPSSAPATAAATSPTITICRRTSVSLPNTTPPKNDAVRWWSICLTSIIAHCLYHAADVERRQILEARLLTGESDEEIARRFDIAPDAVNCYEKLFFNVRDRLHCSDWIYLTTLRRPAAGAANENGALTDEERGFVYRRFGYYGGPLVLDAEISVLGPIEAPQRGENLGAWMDEAFGEIVRTRAALAASSLATGNRDAMRLIRLAVKQNGKAAKDRSEVPDAARAKHMCAVLESINSAMAGNMADVRRAD